MSLRQLIRETLEEFSMGGVFRQGKRSKKAKAIKKPMAIGTEVWTFIYDAVRRATDNYFMKHPNEDTISNRGKRSKKYAIEFERIYKSMDNPDDWQRFVRKKLKLGERNG